MMRFNYSFRLEMLFLISALLDWVLQSPNPVSSPSLSFLYTEDLVKFWWTLVFWLDSRCFRDAHNDTGHWSFKKGKQQKTYWIFAQNERGSRIMVFSCLFFKYCFVVIIFVTFYSVLESIFWFWFWFYLIWFTILHRPTSFWSNIRHL